MVHIEEDIGEFGLRAVSGLPLKLLQALRSRLLLTFALIVLAPVEAVEAEAEALPLPPCCCIFDDLINERNDQ